MKILLVYLVVLCSLYFHDCRRLSNNARRRSSDKSFGSELDNFLLQKRLHQLKQFSRTATKRLASLTDYDRFYNTYLKEILRVRVPGTVGHSLVKKFIADTLKGYGWKVEEQTFENDTPFGRKNFTNIIATLYPEADRVIALSAHYDSKLLPPENGKYFIAATDSAVPVAMLLDMAKVLSEKAKSVKNAPRKVSPQLLIVDGEEAFVTWGPNDSIYGSKYLASNFSGTPHHNPTLAAKGLTRLDSLDAFVLLDLLGAKDPLIYEHFKTTEHLYTALQGIEKNLRQMNEFTGCSPSHGCVYFPGAPFQQMYIEDDHIPFFTKNVPILHVIATPFPDVWHKLSDDESAIDPNTVVNLLKIFRHFICAYVGLE